MTDIRRMPAVLIEFDPESGVTFEYVNNIITRYLSSKGYVKSVRVGSLDKSIPPHKRGLLGDFTQTEEMPVNEENQIFNELTPLLRDCLKETNKLRNQLCSVLPRTFDIERIASALDKYSIRTQAGHVIQTDLAKRIVKMGGFPDIDPEE